MRTLWHIAFLVFFITGVLSAQESVITPETPVASATLTRWLHGPDPRLIAWAADFARRNHDTTLLSEMPALLEHWIMPSAYGGDDAQQAQRSSILAVLDALIQENVQVPVAAIDAVAPSFPAQAAILIGRMPLSTSRATLDDWTYGSVGPRGWMLARIASMMLANDPQGRTIAWNGDTANFVTSFVGSVVVATEHEVRISIRSYDSQNPGFGSNTCGDFFGRPLEPGWPKVYRYDLDEANDRQASGPIIVDLDGDRIFSLRHKEHEGWGSCSGVDPLNPSTRHRLLAHWLGVSEREMSWQPVDTFTIIWTSEMAYERQLGKIVDSERRKLSDTVAALRQRRFLNENETPMPRLVVSVHCDTTPCPLR